MLKTELYFHDKTSFQSFLKKQVRTKFYLPVSQSYSYVHNERHSFIKVGKKQMLDWTGSNWLSRKTIRQNRQTICQIRRVKWGGVPPSPSSPETSLHTGLWAARSDTRAIHTPKFCQIRNAFPRTDPLKNTQKKIDRFSNLWYNKL